MQSVASQHIPQSQLQGYNNPNQTSQTPIIDEQASRISTYQNPIKSEFGKIKGIEVLSLKEAELEKTLNGVTKFATVGILQVLYFANYDRFVLSLHDWKYALLKRLPITASENTTIGPISYTLPTYNGFYTLTLPKVQHLEGLKNLETIFINNSRFAYKGSDVFTGGRSPDDRFRSMESTPREMNYQPSYGTPTSMGRQSVPMTGQPTSMMSGQPTSMMSGQPNSMSGEPMSTSQQQEGVAGPLSKGQKWKRGFKKFGFIFTGRMSKKEKLNLNNYQARDIETLKTTNEVMAPFHLYPRREVERWITYNKEIANGLGYAAEGYQDGLHNSFMGETRMRGYGSVDLGQGSLSNPIPLEGGISCNRPSLDDTGYTCGQLHSVPVGKNPQNYSKIRWTDKVKAKIPGEHHYYGEKIPGGVIQSHSIHPEVPENLGQSIGLTPTKSIPGNLLGEEFTQPILKTENIASTNTSIMQQQIPVTHSMEYQKTSSPMNMRPVGEAYAQSFSHQPATIYQTSDLTRQAEPLRTSGETYYQLGAQNRLVEHQIPSNIHPSTIHSSEYQRASGPMSSIHGRPIGESYIKSFEQPIEARQGETYPATIQTTASENLRYRYADQPPSISQSYQAPSFGEPAEIRQETRLAEEQRPSEIHTSIRTAGFTGGEEQEQEQAFQQTMTPITETHYSEFNREPNVLYESGNLPSLAQRIRTTPTKSSVIVENSGLPTTSGSPTFLQKIKNVFSGRPETASTQSNRDVREPVTETNVPMSQMDIIRGQNAHYEA